MKERPILFSAPMVRAILNSAKTQTRRVVKGAPDDWAPVGPEFYAPTVVDRFGDEQPGPEDYGAGNQDGSDWIRCPYGQPGDRLWVRETHAPQPDCSLAWDRWLRGDGGRKPIIHYKADDSPRAWVDRWRPSIHMPRWASRILLEITGVRVERLHDISEADAIAEGCANSLHLPGGRFARENFSHLWWAINGDGSWEANSWVWCIEFKRANLPVTEGENQ